MKRLLSLSLALIMALALTACGPKEKPNDGSQAGSNPGTDASQSADQSSASTGDASVEGPEVESGSAYTFHYKGCDLPMNAEFAPLLAFIGEPDNYFEAESCAFQGLDKTYTYADMELLTYPVDGVDYISSIRLLADTAATPEGITIGSTPEEVEAAYGPDFQESAGQYTYVEGDTMLAILFQDGKAISVEYVALNSELI